MRARSVGCAAAAAPTTARRSQAVRTGRMHIPGHRCLVFFAVADEYEPNDPQGDPTVNQQPGRENVHATPRFS